jgi:hypothetical protein
MRKINYIILHHTASPGKGDGSAEWKQICQNAQEVRGRDYLCDYHYGIGPTGLLFDGQLEANPSWNCGKDDINYESIAVACIGNFEENEMSDSQKNRLIQTIQELKIRFVNARVMLHKEIVATLCPGKNYPSKEVLASIQKDRRFKDITPSQIFYKAIQYVVRQGIMNGDSAGEGTFRPDDPVTRGELAQVLWNLGQK